MGSKLITNQLFYGFWDKTSTIDTLTVSLLFGSGNFGAYDYGGGLGVLGGTHFSVWGSTT
jgi:hypothetical protein